MRRRSHSPPVGTTSHGDEAEHDYHRRLHELQIELVKFQRHLIKRGARVLVLIEGRDAAGKDGMIKHVVEHLSPRDTRAVALPAPTEINHKGLTSSSLLAKNNPPAGRLKRATSCRN